MADSSPSPEERQFFMELVDEVEVEMKRLELGHGLANSTDDDRDPERQV